MEFQKEKKAGVIRVILLIVAAALLIFICWKAGWILNGNKNQVSEQEKQAIRWYSWIALAAGWPQVCFFLEGLKSESLRNEILELLALLADYSCD